MDDNIEDKSAEHSQPIVVKPVTRSPPQIRMKKSYRKKVKKEWSHEDTVKFIKEIEMRRSLSMLTLKSSEKKSGQGTKNPKTPSVLLCEYMASELDTLTPQQATLARLKLRRAFSDVMEEVLMPSSSQQEQSRQVSSDTSHFVYIAQDSADTSESFYENESATK